MSLDWFLDAVQSALQAMDGIQTHSFMLGLLVGLVIGFFFWLYGSVLRERYLWQCMDQKSAVKIGREFYYIVPSMDYVHSDLNYPKKSASVTSIK